MRLRRITVTTLGVAGLLYHGMLRHAVLTWGATQAEALARLPGDELLENADGRTTRAVTIAAPTSAVWPWLAQMQRAVSASA